MLPCLCKFTDLLRDFGLISPHFFPRASFTGTEPLLKELKGLPFPHNDMLHNRPGMKTQLYLEGQSSSPGIVMTQLSSAGKGCKDKVGMAQGPVTASVYTTYKPKIIFSVLDS